MSTEAWKAREMERRALIDGLYNRFMNMSEACGVSGESIEAADAPYLAAATKCLVALAGQRGDPDRIGRTEQQSIEQYLKDAFADIGKAARSPEEAQVLVSALAKKFLESGLTSFHSRLNLQEMREPNRIYGAPSAMARVPLPTS